MEYEELVDKVIDLYGEGKDKKEIAEICEADEALVAMILIKTKDLYFR